MALELKSKKRKASLPSDKIAKVQKVQKIAAEVLPKKRKATDDAIPAVQKKPKATTDDVPLKSALKKAKKSSEAAEAADEVLAKKPKSSKDVSKAQRKLKTAAAVEEQEDIAEDVSDDAEDEILDDQTEALLKGFESDEDEEHAADDFDREGQPIPELDKKTKKKMKKLKEKLAEKAKSDGPGVIYLGRIPHGFYEYEMKQYFTQFGEIKNIRLSRNPQTGASKHFAFIEFESYDVAEIVAKTMDNYLMFNHILKCKIVPKDQVHENLFIGANRRFKKVPWNKLEGRKLQMGIGETKWEERIEKEKKKREQKNVALKEIGYSYDGPSLKSTRDIPKSAKTSLILEAAANEEVEQMQAEKASKTSTTEISTTSVEKGGRKQKSKKVKTAVDGTTMQEGAAEEETKATTVEEALWAQVEPKAKKGKKAKMADIVAEVEPNVTAAEDIEEATPVNGPKTRSKKAKAKKVKATV